MARFMGRGSFQQWTPMGLDDRREHSDPNARRPKKNPPGTHAHTRAWNPL